VCRWRIFEVWPPPLYFLEFHLLQNVCDGPLFLYIRSEDVKWSATRNILTSSKQDVAEPYVRKRNELLWDKTLKESRNRPDVAQRVPGGLGSQISWHSAREGGEVVSLAHRPPLPPAMFLVLIFTRGWVDPKAMVRSEGNMSLKNPVTPPGIDPGTVRPLRYPRPNY
jgi:hypothetical protein